MCCTELFTWWEFEFWRYLDGYPYRLKSFFCQIFKTEYGIHLVIFLLHVTFHGSWVSSFHVRTSTLLKIIFARFKTKIQGKQRSLSFLYFFYKCQWFYFEFQQLYSQWQESKDSNINPVTIKKCYPDFIRLRLRCNGNTTHLTPMHNFLYIRQSIPGVRGLHRLEITLTLSRAPMTLIPVDHRCSQ